MRPLNVLICGSDELALQRMARSLTLDEGVQVQVSSKPADWFAAGQQVWDFLIIDLDGLNSFLRMLLPGICSNFPNLPVIGVSTKNIPGNDFTGADSGLKLDACLFKLPKPEDLIVCAPRVAAKYLCDTKPLM